MFQIAWFLKGIFANLAKNEKFVMDRNSKEL